MDEASVNAHIRWTDDDIIYWRAIADGDDRTRSRYAAQMLTYYNSRMQSLLQQRKALGLSGSRQDLVRQGVVTL